MNYVTWLARGVAYCRIMELTLVSSVHWTLRWKQEQNSLDTSAGDDATGS